MFVPLWVVVAWFIVLISFAVWLMISISMAAYAARHARMIASQIDYLTSSNYYKVVMSAELMKIWAKTLRGK